MSAAPLCCALLAGCALAVALGPGPASARLDDLRLIAGRRGAGVRRTGAGGPDPGAGGTGASWPGASVPRTWWMAWLTKLRGVAARKREATRQRAAVIEVARALATELRAGRTPAEALELAVRASATGLGQGPAQQLLEAARVGADPPDVAKAFDVVGNEPALSGCRHLAACWRIGSGSGAGFAVALDQVAAALRSDARAREELQAQMEGPRSTARLLAGLPLFGLVLGAAMGASPLTFLFGTAVGWACAITAVGLEIAGLAWTRRLVRRATADVAPHGFT